MNKATYITKYKEAIETRNKLDNLLRGRWYTPEKTWGIEWLTEYRDEGLKTTISIIKDGKSIYFPLNTIPIEVLEQAMRIRKAIQDWENGGDFYPEN